MNKKLFKILCIAAPAALALALVGPATPNSYAKQGGSGITKADEKGKVNLDFTDADIKDVVKSISELTGKNFILDERVRGKITMISPTPVTVQEAYQAFISALEVKNFTVVRIGKIYKIVPKRAAKRMPIRTVSEDYRTPYGDAFVTRLIPIKYISANEIARSLKSLTSSDGMITAYGPTNTLIVTDSASNIRRLMSIIRRLDKKTFQAQVEVIPLKYASAVDMAKKLQEIFPTQKQGRSTFSRRRRTTRTGDVEGKQIISKIIPDERTNSLIVLANAQGIAKVREFVSRLDRVTDLPSGKIHVYYLKHADAEELSATLSGVASQVKAGGKKGGGAAGGQLFGGDIRITADKSTNSLVIIASQQDYEFLRPVIEQLDIPRRQVFIEALFLEVSSTPEMNVGWSGNLGGNVGGVGGKTTMFGGTLFPGLNALNPAAITSASGAIFGFRGKEITLTINGEQTKLPIYGAVFNALQKSNIVNVVSTPTLLTMDNKEAEIVIGKEVPFPVTASQSTGAAGAPVIQQIDRKDVATILKVKPQINESDYITLDLYAEVSSIAEPNPTLGATTAKRKAKTTVVAQSGQTIVIGGLIKDRENNVVNKVPLLGDIPLLGWFFRNKSKHVDKVNLMIYITPYVIHNPLDMERVTRQQHRKLRRSIHRSGLREPTMLKQNILEDRFSAPPDREKKKYERTMPSKPSSSREINNSGGSAELAPVKGHDENGEFIKIKSSGGSSGKTKDNIESPFDDVRPPSSD